MLVIGEKEVEAQKIAVRKRKSKETRIMDLEDFVSELREAEAEKTMD